jgi:hypothetical protein
VFSPSASESHIHADDEGRTAATEYTFSDSDSDDPQAADAFHSSSDDDAIGVPMVHAIFKGQSALMDVIEDENSDVSLPDAVATDSIPGPFNASFFANIPSEWMDPPSDEGDDDDDNNSEVDDSMDVS